MSDKKIPLPEGIKENPEHIGAAFNAVLIYETGNDNIEGAIEFLEDLIKNKEDWSSAEIIRSIENSYDIEYVPIDKLEAHLQELVESFIDLEPTKIEGLKPGMKLPIGEELAEFIDPIRDKLVEIRTWLSHYERLNKILTHFIIEAASTRYQIVVEEGYDFEIKGDSIIIQEDPTQAIQGIQQAMNRNKGN